MKKVTNLFLMLMLLWAGNSWGQNVFFEGFETGNTQGAVPVSWTQVSVTGSAKWYANNTLTTYNRTPRTGSWNAYLQYSNTDWLFKQVTLTGGTTYKLTFYARQDVTSGTNVLASYGTTNSVAGMTNAIIASTAVTNGNYQLFSGTFSPAASGTYYIGIRADLSSTPWYISIDDISLDMLVAGTPDPPTNPSPANAAVSVPINGNLTWTFGTNSVTYDLKFGPTGNMTQVVTGATAGATGTYAYSNLNSFSIYQWQVIVHNGALVTNGPIWSFTTACGVASVPFTENFDSYTVPAVGCGTIIDANSDLVKWVNSTGTPYNGLNKLHIGYSAAGVDQNDWYITQGLTLTGGKSYDVKFYYKGGASSYFEKLEVKWGNAASAAGMTSAAIFSDISFYKAAYTLGVASFTPATTGTYYVGWHCFSIGDQLGIDVDQITIEATPSCPSPSALTATSITPTSAILGWTENGTATSWDIEWGLAPFAQGAGTPVLDVTNPYILKELSAKRSYAFYVRANCGSEYSQWSGPFTFVTPCEASPVPFIENFEASTFPPECWSLVAGSGNWARVTTASGYGIGTASATANFYGISGATPFDIITFSFSAPNAVLSFDHAYATYQTEVDKLRVMYSTDGGANFTELILLNGGPTGPLATAPATTGSFVPTAAQWATKTYTLPAGTNKVKFQAISAYGNNLYIDNIQVFVPAIVTGVVTSTLTGNPIAGASVKIGGYPAVLTLADGSYQATVKDGTYDVLCAATGFNPKTVAGVALVNGSVVNIGLDSPTMDVNPLSVTEVLNYGTTSTREVTITNNGNGPLDWTASIDYSVKSPVRESVSYTFKSVEGITGQADKNAQINPSNPTDGALWDNTNINRTTSGIVSNELTGVVPDGRVITADDFIVPPFETWTINNVYTEGFSTTSPVILPNSFAVEIYSDLAGRPGALIYAEKIVPAGINFTTQDLNLSTPLVLTEGHYWLSVYAVYKDGTSLTLTRWNWYTGSLPIATEAALNDFGGFFGLPEAGWFYMSELGVPEVSCYFIINGDKLMATPWVGISENSGTLLPGESKVLTLSFDANRALGTYHSNLIFNSNPNVGEIIVPITLEVIGQEIMVPAANGWGGISTNIDVNAKGSASMEFLLAEIKESMVILVGEEGIYWPGQNINTFPGGNWNNNFGYKIKMIAEDELIFGGTPLVDKTVTFTAGTHIIPVLSNGPVSAHSIFDNKPIEYAFGYDGSIFWPTGDIYTLTSLVPGYGYLVRFNATATLDFGGAKEGFTTNNLPVFVNNTTWNNVSRTGDVHIIGVAPEACTNLMAGDVLGVFNIEGLCTGMAEYSGNGAFALVAYADDQTTAVNDGLISFEPMVLKVFRNGHEMEVNPVYNTEMPNADGLFVNNGLSQITSLKFGPLAIGENGLNGVAIYPNPSTGIFNLTGISNPIQMSVTNSHGQLIYTSQLNGSQQLDLSNQPAGVYFIRLVGENSVRLEKLIVK